MAHSCLQKPRWRCSHDSSSSPQSAHLLFCGLETLESRQLMSASALAAACHEFHLHRNRQFQSRPERRDRIPAKLRRVRSRKSDRSATGGTGVANPQGLLGPDDSDKEVIASPDGRLLFAVNQGSNSIAVFRVIATGRSGSSMIRPSVPAAPSPSASPSPTAGSTSSIAETKSRAKPARSLPPSRSSTSGPMAFSRQTSRPRRHCLSAFPRPSC